MSSLISGPAASQDQSLRPQKLLCAAIFSREGTKSPLRSSSVTPGDRSPNTAPSVGSFQRGRNPFQLSPTLLPQPRKRTSSYTEEHERRKECAKAQAQRDSETVEAMQRNSMKSYTAYVKLRKNSKADLVEVRRRHLLWSQRRSVDGT